MIVVTGRLDGGLAPDIARRVVPRAGVQLVGAVDPGPDGDRVLLALAAAGVGHAAVTRTSAGELEPADLELALRYLPDVRVIVLGGSAALAASAAAAASWSGAALVVVTGLGEPLPDLEPTARAIVMAAPARDPDGAFAGLIAELATRLDAGAEPADAWDASVAALGIERVGARPIRGAAGAR